VTLDTFLRPHDLNTTYLRFATGLGVQVSTSHPVFMRRQQFPPRPDERPAFPLDMDTSRGRRSCSALGACKRLTQACTARGTTSRCRAPIGTVPSYSKAFRPSMTPCDGCPHGWHRRVEPLRVLMDPAKSAQGWKPVTRRYFTTDVTFPLFRRRNAG
jgi:hypothetical protein